MISMIAYGMRREEEEAYRKGGPEAVKRVQHGNMGSFIGMTSGALTGAAIGSIVPVIGTGIGFFVGSFCGGLAGKLNDKTAGDNLRSAGKLALTLAGLFSK